MRPEECIGGIGCDHPLGASVRLLTTLCGDPVLLAGDCDENALSTSGDFGLPIIANALRDKISIDMSA